MFLINKELLFLKMSSPVNEDQKKKFVNTLHWWCSEVNERTDMAANWQYNSTWALSAKILVQQAR